MKRILVISALVVAVGGCSTAGSAPTPSASTAAPMAIITSGDVADPARPYHENLEAMRAEGAHGLVFRLLPAARDLDGAAAELARLAKKFATGDPDRSISAWRQALVVANEALVAFQGSQVGIAQDAEAAGLSVTEMLGIC